MFDQPRAVEQLPPFAFGLRRVEPQRAGKAHRVGSPVSGLTQIGTTATVKDEARNRTDKDEQWRRAAAGGQICRRTEANVSMANSGSGWITAQATPTACS